MAKEAIELHIEGMIAYGEPVPEESASPQYAIVTVTVGEAA